MTVRSIVASNDEILIMAQAYSFSDLKEFVRQKGHLFYNFYKYFIPTGMIVNTLYGTHFNNEFLIIAGDGSGQTWKLLRSFNMKVSVIAPC